MTERTFNFTLVSKIRYPLIVIALASFALFGCLNPIDFKPELHVTGDLNVSGQLDVNSVNRDSAVLTVVNRTKSIDVVNTTIRAYNEHGAKVDPPVREYGNPASSPPLEGRPLHGRRAEWYLTPQQWDYEIIMTYKSIDPAKPVAPDAGPLETRTSSIVMSLARPGQPYYVYIVRTKDGVIVVDKNVPDDLDVEDTTNPTPDPNTDPDEGEGSVPAVIPPHNHDKMGVFVVVNKTKTTDIDYVQFATHPSQPAKTYLMGRPHGTDPNARCEDAVINGIADPHNIIAHEPAKNDQMSIALRQGTWRAKVVYRSLAGDALDDTALREYSKSRNVVVQPVKDPMSLKTNFLYFYRTDTGDFALSPEWPAPDAEEESNIEVEAGSELFIIRNNAPNTFVKELRVIDAFGTNARRDITFMEFDPWGYVGYGTVKKASLYQAQYPIINGRQYKIEVIVQDASQSNRGLLVVTRWINLYVGGRYNITLTADEINGSTPEIPPVTYKPVTKINEMPIAVRSDGSLEIYIGKQASTTDQYVGYGPITVSPANAGAFTVLPAANRKIQYALVDASGTVYRLGDSASVGTFVVANSLNFAEFGDPMKWTLKLDALPNAAVNYSQKVTLKPPAFAPSKSDYDGKYPEITVRVYVAGGIDEHTEYYENFRIQAYAPTAPSPNPIVQNITLYGSIRWILGLPILPSIPAKFTRGEKNGLIFGFTPINVAKGDIPMQAYKKVEILSGGTANAYLCSFQDDTNYGSTYFKPGDNTTTVCVFPTTTGTVKLKLSIPAEYNNGVEVFEISTVDVR